MEVDGQFAAAYHEINLVTIVSIEFRLGQYRRPQGAWPGRASPVQTLTTGLATHREPKHTALHQRLHNALRGAAEDKARLTVDILFLQDPNILRISLLSAWCPIISLFLQLTGITSTSHLPFGNALLNGHSSCVYRAYQHPGYRRAPSLPFTNKVQELVACDENDPPTASSNGTPISASARWAQVASSVAKQVPASLLNANIPSNFVSAVQKAIGAAQHIPGPQTPRPILPIPAPPPSPAVPKTNPMLEWFKQRGPGAFNPPTGPAPSLAQQAVAQLKKNQAHPVSAAVEQLHRSQQHRPPGSSPARKSSTGDKAATAHLSNTQSYDGSQSCSQGIFSLAWAQGRQIISGAQRISGAEGSDGAEGIQGANAECVRVTKEGQGTKAEEAGSRD